MPALVRDRHPLQGLHDPAARLFPRHLAPRLSDVEQGLADEVFHRQKRLTVRSDTKISHMNELRVFAATETCERLRFDAKTIDEPLIERKLRV